MGRLGLLDGDALMAAMIRFSAPRTVRITTICRTTMTEAAIASAANSIITYTPWFREGALLSCISSMMRCRPGA
jgi:hypothetical protein